MSDAPASQRHAIHDKYKPLQKLLYVGKIGEHPIHIRFGGGGSKLNVRWCDATGRAYPKETFETGQDQQTWGLIEWNDETRKLWEDAEKQPSESMADAQGYYSEPIKKAWLEKTGYPEKRALALFEKIGEKSRGWRNVFYNSPNTSTETSAARPRKSKSGRTPTKSSKKASTPKHAQFGKFKRSAVDPYKGPFNFQAYLRENNKTTDIISQSFLTYDGQQGVGFTAWMQSILYHDFGIVVDSTALDVAIPIYIKSGKPMLTNATRGIIWEADDNHSEFQKVNNDLGFPSDENGEVLFDEIKVKVKKENARTWTVDNAETTARDILAAHEYPDLPFDEPGEFPDDAVKAFKQSIIDHAYKVRAAELEQAMQDAFTGEDDAADPDAPMPSIESNGGKMNRSVSPSGQRSSSSDDDDHDKDDNDVSDESSEDSDQSDSDDDKRPKKIRKSDPASSVSADSVSDADYETDTTWDQKRMIKNQNRAERRAAMEHAS